MRLKMNINHFLTILAILAVLELIITLVPILLVTFANRAAGDDLWYSTQTRQAFLATHSLIEVFKAGFGTVADYYNRWQGTWSSLFLFTLQPEVFHYKAYVVVIPVTIISYLVTVTFVMHYLLTKIVGFDKKSFLIINSLFIVMCLTYNPGVRSALTWYNGIIHYQFPFILSIWLLYLLTKYVTQPKRGHSAGIIIIMIYLGGSNYLLAVFGLLIVSITMIFLLLRKELNRIPVLAISLTLELIGLFISMIAPGNKVRGGEDFGFSFTRIITTIGKSLVDSVVQGALYLAERPFVMIGLFFVLVLIAYFQINNQVKRKYPYPGIFFILTFGIYAAMYAPSIYAGAPEAYTMGIDNIQYQILLMFILANGIYLSGYLAKYINARQKAGSQYVPSTLVIMMILCLIAAGANYRNIFDSVTYQSYRLIKSGEASEYKRYMDISTKILLDENIKDAVLPGIFEIPFPLHNEMAYVDPQGINNIFISAYYGKNSVVAIHKEEWHKIYGD